MLRAEAAVFEPKAAAADVSEDASNEYTEKKMDTSYFDDLCATAVPSPALTSVSASSMWSPYWTYDDYTWSAQQSPALWMTPDICLDVEQFALPDAEESEDAEETPERPEEKEKEFALTGLSDLQSSLSQLLNAQLPAKTEDLETAVNEETQLDEEPTAAWYPPPGLDLPPGLELPAANASAAKPESFDLPPGLEKGLEPAKKNGAKNAGKGPVLSSNCTTIMLRNIPNKYGQERLVEQLHRDGYKGDIDFLYLPIDFKNLCNVGYAFLNFRTAEACHRFASEYHNVNSCDKLPGFKSKKICEVAEATCQGCEKNVSRLQKSPVMAQLVAKPEWLPLLLGPGGEIMKFPVLDNVSDYQPPVRGGAPPSQGMSKRGRAGTAQKGEYNKK